MGSAAGDESADAAPADEPSRLLGLIHINARDRSTVEHELALRLGSSPDSVCHRRRDLRHEARGVGYWFLTGGPVSYFYRRYPTGAVASSQSD